MEALHDVNDAARLLAVSPWTIRAYIRQGRLHPVRIGRLVRLDEQELERFVAQAKASCCAAEEPPVQQGGGK
jgi:excisionase family DNA binding protein